MQSDLTKRLFRAISIRSDKELLFSCKRIIEAERKKGHLILAKELEAILDSRLDSDIDDKNLSALPMSRRSNDALVTILNRDSVRHHMILNDDVEQRLQRIEKEYAARERLARFGFVHKKKILLYGPPGCGKTLGAERLAWNTGLPLVKVRFDAMISSYFGESAANLRRIFDSANATPSVLFLDECDFIAKSRNLGNDVGEIPRIVNTLLQLLEDYDAPGLLIAATNLDTMLDKAIFRRFDDVFEIPMPGSEQIINLLKMSLSAVEICGDIDWRYLAGLLVGVSAANVVKAAQDAAKSAILSGENRISQAELENSIREIYLLDQQGDLFHGKSG